MNNLIRKTARVLRTRVDAALVSAAWLADEDVAATIVTKVLSRSGQPRYLLEIMEPRPCKPTTSGQ